MAKTKETTVCDQPSMLGITIMLADMMQQLQNAVEAEIWIIKVFPDQNHNDARHQHRDDKQRLDDAGEFLMPDVIQNQRGQ